LNGKSLAGPQHHQPTICKAKEGEWRRPTIHNPLRRWLDRAAAMVAVAKLVNDPEDPANSKEGHQSLTAEVFRIALNTL
jgi:hypothetical protein